MNNTFKRSVLALTLVTLFGCGGSDSSSGDTTPPVVTPTTMTIKAIDGYLVNAEVYLDTNGNNKIDGTDTYVGLTDTNGEIKITTEELHPVIVRAIAGFTYDQDTGGRIKRSYEMISVDGKTVVTPFTTLARLNDTTTEEVAAELGYDAELVGGDYVADQSHEADKTHLLARSTVELLGGDLSTTEAEAEIIKAKTAGMTGTIDAMVNDGTDLGTMVISSDGQPEPKMPALDAYLDDVTLYQFSTNETRFEREGYSQLQFKEEKMSYNNFMMSESFTTDVAVGNNSYKRSNDGRTEDFIYLSKEFGLTVSSQGTLDFVTTDATMVDENTGMVNFNFIHLDASSFAGKTMYWLIDDAEESDKPAPTLMTFEFNTDFRGVMTVVGQPLQPFSWNMGTDGEIIISRDNGDKVLTFQPVIQNDDMVVCLMRHSATKYSRIPMFLVGERDLANNLYADWVGR